jgi:hypothetical protein
MKRTSIKTGCWFGQIPDDHVRIGISRGTPRFSGITGYRLYRKLNPGSWFNSVPTPEYLERYQTEVLDRLDAQDVLDDLVRISNGCVPVLCCFERVGSGQWCHRSLVAQWLSETLGIKVPEIGHEHLPQAQHPLLPPKEGEIHQGKLL